MSAIATIIIRTAGGAIGTMIVNRGPAGPSGASDFGDLGGLPAENVALAAALDLKAPLDSPTFTGPVAAPSVVTSGASGSFITTVKDGLGDAGAAIAADATGAGYVFIAANETSGANIKAGNLTDYRDIQLPNASGTLALTSDLALKAPLANPIFTGNVTAAGAVNAGARVTATRGTVGVGTVFTNFSLTGVTGTSTDFLSRFVVGDSITFNTVNGSETKVITAIASDTAMTTLPFSSPSASGAEAYTHSTASAVMNPSGAITGTTGTFSRAIGATTGAFSVAVTAPIVQAASGKFQINTNASGASGAGSVRFGGGTINTLESWGGTAGGALYIYSEGNIRALIGGSSGINLYQSVYPDNTTRTLGLSTFRWGTLFGTSADLTGTIKTVAYLKATAIATSHATAIAAGDGAQAYISDDDKPVWSNGTVWKLADGTTLA